MTNVSSIGKHLQNQQRQPTQSCRHCVSIKCINVQRKGERMTDKEIERMYEEVKESLDVLDATTNKDDIKPLDPTVTTTNTMR